MSLAPQQMWVGKVCISHTKWTKKKKIGIAPGSDLHQIDIFFSIVTLRRKFQEENSFLNSVFFCLGFWRQTIWFLTMFCGPFSKISRCVEHKLFSGISLVFHQMFPLTPSIPSRMIDARDVAWRNEELEKKKSKDRKKKYETSQVNHYQFFLRN